MEPTLTIKISSFDMPAGFELLCFAPVSRCVVGWSPDSGLLLSHFTGAPIASEGLERSPVKASLTPDGLGLVVLTRAEPQLRLYQIDPTAGTFRLNKATTAALPGDVSDVAWTPDGTLLVVGLSDGEVFFASCRPGEELVPTPVPNFGEQVRQVQCASRCIVVTLEPAPDEESEMDDQPDRTRRWWRSSNPTLKVYTVSSGAVVAIAQHPLIDTPGGYTQSMGFSDDGRHLWRGFVDGGLSITDVGVQSWRASQSWGGEVRFGKECLGYIEMSRRYGDRLVVRRLTPQGPVEWGEQYAPSGLRSLEFADGADGTYVAWLLSDKVEVSRLVHPDVLATYSADPVSRLAAVQRVGRQRVADGVPRLLHLAKEGSLDDRSVVVPALLEIDSDEAIDAVLSLDAEDPHVQQGLRGLDSARARSAVERCISGRRRSTLLGVVHMLLLRPEIPATAELSEILADRAPRVREVAAQALAMRGDLRALVPLVAALSDPDDAVAWQVWTAILAILPADGVAQPLQPGPSLAAVAAFVQQLCDVGNTEKAQELAPDGWAILRDISGALLVESRPPLQAGDSSKPFKPVESQSNLSVHFSSIDQVLNALKDVGRREQHRATAMALCFMAAGHLQLLGDRDQELAFLIQAAEHCASLNAPEIEWRLQGGIADCHAFKNRWGEADERYAGAEMVIQRMWTQLLGDLEDRHFFADKAQLFDDAMVCRLKLGRTAEALDTLERAKTRFLGDLIARRHNPPHEGLSEVDQEFWQALGGRSALASSAVKDQNIATSGEIVDVTLGARVEDPVLPVAFAALVEGSSRTSHTPMVSDLWSVVAVLQHEEVPGEVDDATRGALADIAAGLADMRAAAEGHGNAGGGEAVELYLAGARALSSVALPRSSQQTGSDPPPGWALDEFRGWEPSYVEGDLTYSPLVDALLEAAAFVSGQGVVLSGPGLVAGMGPTDDDGGGRVLPVFSVAVPGESTNDHDAHPMATTALSLVKTSRWKYVSQLTRGTSAGVPDAARILSGLPNTALIQFALTRSGTVIYLFSPQGDGALDTAEGLPAVAGWTGPAVFTVPELTQIDLHQRIYAANGWMPLYRRRVVDPNSWARATDQLLGDLYDSLFRPIRGWLAERRIRQLLIVPHRDLHLLPLSAWYDPRRRRRRYVGDDFEVSVVPSLTLLKVCVERQDERSRPAVKDTGPLAILDPTCDLPVSRLDALAVSTLPTPSGVLAGSGATLEKVRQASGSADPFHFAGHGRYILDDPLGSRLELAGANLTLGDLFDGVVSISAGASIVLPACETWMTDCDDPADEHLGIASGFLFAGGGSVLSTQWAVDELSAALIMARYYEALPRRSPSGALAEAQRALRSASRRDVRRLMSRIDTLLRLGILDERSRQELGRIAQGIHHRRIDYSHPIYWAAFTVTAAPASAVR